MKYHTRWSELTQQTICPIKIGQTPFRGYVYLTESTRLDELPTVDAATEPAVLEKENLEALQDILDLAEAEDIQVVLLLAPYQLDDKAAREVQAIRQYARERAVTLLDMNQLYREIGLDPQEDFLMSGI